MSLVFSVVLDCHLQAVGPGLLVVEDDPDLCRHGVLVRVAASCLVGDIYAVAQGRMDTCNLVMYERGHACHH
jgi:hypothetical protein